MWRGDRPAGGEIATIGASRVNNEPRNVATTKWARPKEGKTKIIKSEDQHSVAKLAYNLINDRHPTKQATILREIILSLRR